MDFVPVYEDELQRRRSPVSGPRGRHALAGAAPAPRRPQRGDAARRRSSSAIRTVGRVAADERRLHHVHTKFEGYVEHLYVDFTGKLVRKGEPLALDLQPRARRDPAGVPARPPALRSSSARAASRSVAQGGADLLEAARQRLLLWDIRAEDIATLERTRQGAAAPSTSTPTSPATSCRRTAVHGMRVMPADTLFDIADLSHLWVLADVYESDLPRIRLGHDGARSRVALPARTRPGAGRSPTSHPTVEEKTRTVKVRIEVDEPGRRAEARHVRGRRPRAWTSATGLVVPGRAPSSTPATASSSSSTDGEDASSRARCSSARKLRERLRRSSAASRRASASSPRPTSCSTPSRA